MKHVNDIPCAVIASTLALGIMIDIGGCGRQVANHAEMKPGAFPKERVLPDGTFYQSEFNKCFPNESIADSRSSNVYVCGAVQKPQALKLEGETTLGAALGKCGGLGKRAFGITLLRRRENVYSMISIGLVAELYKPTGYEQIPLRKGDVIIVVEESF